ncbi:hypothetical protein QFZ36_002898 [Pseudarthrobacter siccitolerans]|uniref:DUF4190 domain-containing protein n=1 Tax=Pseudarthrobacter siccitolerans TaxID=861266 RepID=A0ABU0PNQ3_9MICC|nr:DUF4190 domain-containing protein [Pseudarthrobacter siccitolerans]MDQ0675337.1 hypothetical protein [Pseudarthrobacter siccitolerans]
MTDQPAHRPESQYPDGSSTPSGFEPPRFAPPYGSGAASQPQYGQGSYSQGNEGQGDYGRGKDAQAGYGQGSYGQSQYGQAGYGQGHFGQGGYGQSPNAGQSQYGTYNQPPSAYNQPAGPYGQPGYYGMPAEPKTLSIASMVCGIASVIMGWILLPQIAAIITGHMALKREPTGKGMSITGLVLGYLCLLGYGAFWLLAIIGLAIASTSTSSSYTF